MLAMGASTEEGKMILLVIYKLLSAIDDMMEVQRELE